jgi:hypothetical protein
MCRASTEKLSVHVDIADFAPIASAHSRAAPGLR